MMEDDLRWKTTYDRRPPSMEDDCSQNISKIYIYKKLKITSKKKAIACCLVRYAAFLYDTRPQIDAKWPKIDKSISSVLVPIF